MVPKRFASLGVSSIASIAKSRPGIDHTVWDNLSSDEQDALASPPFIPKPLPSPGVFSAGSPPRPSRDIHPPAEIVPGKEEKEKSRRWGFLKKMSMGKMRTDTPSNSRPGTAQGRPIVVATQRPVLTKFPTSSAAFPIDPRLSTITPQIDVRISTTGALLNSPSTSDLLPTSISKKPSVELLKITPPPTIPEKPSIDVLKPPPVSSNNLLVPTTTPRATKRRSFLPIDVAPIPIPDASSFVPNVTATNDADIDDGAETARAPSHQISQETLSQLQRREEEKAREARTRALRSVMAYLRDMYDLGLSQSNTLSMYGGLTVDSSGLRSRRPTIIEGTAGSRLTTSDGASVLSGLSRPDSHLRSSDAILGLRSGSTTQTNSVATTDSTGSNGEERKFKDDKSKREIGRAHV